MPVHDLPIPEKVDPRWYKEAESLLDHSNTHSLSYFDYHRLIEKIARGLHVAYHEGAHEGASNPYC